MSPYATAEARVSVTFAPSIDAVPVPAMVRDVPPEGVAVTLKALPAGAAPASNGSSKVTTSVFPFTAARRNPGGPVMLFAARRKGDARRPARSRSGLADGRV